MPRGDAANHACRRGVALLSLTVILLIMGLSLSLVLPRAKNDVKRAKEDELRFVQGEFRRASEKFRARNGRKPVSLEELCCDEKGRRFLRKIYRDPMTGKAEWSVLNREGEFEVRSTSGEMSMGGVPYEQFQ